MGRSMLRPYKEQSPMRPSRFQSSHFSIQRTTTAILFFFFFIGLAQAQQKTTARDKPNIRAIIAFINLDRTQ